ncbi:type III secretion system effector phosphothreonine lyase [Burkholderia oklahomensis]|uniref:type III secretion system effector phosphothreonine lyase n=2 Tax=Burkholderia oklahomensis TaxID=342113 RepID=UPI0005D9B4F7|nr:type III secretion system effector phosphothreonine lyase [Burkholderia oklahomensis]AJX30504.1 phosphothreonine lyase ospF [Burkholderia oklahomensis C6786]MBI0361118.1 type III secretion system effector phosphothreonine lyase [Burkholderia oklahomensis]SUW54769.1 27.5 kDa virulence protein [Burkholderia oklahomensis]
MPIRPNLKLNLPPLNVMPVANAKTQSTLEHLCTNRENLRQQMHAFPLQLFGEALHAPDYAGMRQIGFASKSHGFMLENTDLDAFIHARREPPKCLGEFAGDKFHISVQREQVPQAFQALTGLLFSECSPIDKWKVTDIERVDHQSRVGLGAQFTLYVKPDGDDSQYGAALLNTVRNFVEHLELELSKHGISPGLHPESDVRPEHWQYVSYRNELRSERNGSEAQSQALSVEPFYRLMTE